MVDLHNWLSTRQKQIHSEEFNRLEAKKQKLREIVVPQEVASALGDIKSSKNPDEAFYRLLTPEQRKQLETIPLKSPQYVEILLNMIKQQATISSELESRVKTAFQKYLL